MEGEHESVSDDAANAAERVEHAAEAAAEHVLEAAEEAAGAAGDVPADLVRETHSMVAEVRDMLRGGVDEGEQAAEEVTGDAEHAADEIAEGAVDAPEHVANTGVQMERTASSRFRDLFG